MTPRKQPTAIADALDPEKVGRQAQVQAIIGLHMVEMIKIQDRAAALKIENQAELELAAETVSMAQKIAKILEAKRVEATQPLLQEKQTIDKRFKELTDRLDSIKRDVLAKIDAWKAKERSRAQEEYRKQQEQADLDRIAAELESENTKADLGIDIPADMLMTEAPAPPPPAPTRIQTATGGVGERTVWLWEIENLDAVPNKYKLANTVALNAAVRDGIREIPGIKIFQTTKSVAI